MYTTAESVREAIGSARLDNLLPKMDDSDAVDAFITKKILAAQGEMDAHLSRQYSLPLAISGLADQDQQDILNALLEAWCIAITMYIAIPQSAAGAPKGLQIAYDRTMARLRDISNMIYRLPYLAGFSGRNIGILGDELNALTNSLFAASRAYD